jgi:hypothetical protein
MFLPIVSHSFYHFVTFSIVTTHTITQHFGNNLCPYSVEFGLVLTHQKTKKKNVSQNACGLLCVLVMEKVQINKVIKPSLLISTGFAPYFYTDEQPPILLHSPTEICNPRKGEKINNGIIWSYGATLLSTRHSAVKQ